MLVDVEAGGEESERGVSRSALYRIVSSLGVTSPCNLCLQLHWIVQRSTARAACMLSMYMSRNIIQKAVVRIAIARPADG